MDSNYLKAPLTLEEEVRLSTLGNCITLACFRPVDNLKSVLGKRKAGKDVKPLELWAGWPRQALNKILDDEVFNSNILRVTKFVEETFNLKAPGSTTLGRASIGTAARILTLGVMTPYLSLQDEKNRRMPLRASAARLYDGLYRSIVKESVFTFSYVVLSAHFGEVYGTRLRPQIRSGICRAMPALSKALPSKTNVWKTDEEARRKQAERQEKLTNVAVQVLKASTAGAISTILVQPIDYYGRPKDGMYERATRKVLRKATYNAINTSVVQTLWSYKPHRRLISYLPLPPAKA